MTAHLIWWSLRRNQLASEPNYHTTKYFSEDLLAIEMKKAKIKMNKPVYVGMSILDISKTLVYEFWYFIHIKTDDFYKDIANDVEKWFDASNYNEDDKRLPQVRKNKKVIGLFKDELGGNSMIKFVGLIAEAYACWMDDDSANKKVKGTKKCNEKNT